MSKIDRFLHRNAVHMSSSKLNEKLKGNVVGYLAMLIVHVLEPFAFILHSVYTPQSTAHTALKFTER